VTVLCPGFIKTELIADAKEAGTNFEMLAADCGSAVKQLMKGIANDVGVVYVNVGIFWRVLIGAFGYNLIPSFLWNEIAPLTNLSGH